MFRKGIVKENENLSKNNGVVYTEWKGRRHRTLNFQNNDFILTLSNSRRGVHHIDCRQYPMRGYQIHVVFQGQCSYFSILEHTESYQIKISRENFQSICLSLRYSLQIYKAHPVHELTKSEFNIFLNDLKNIAHELNFEYPLFDILSSRQRAMLQWISRVLEKNIPDKKFLRTPSVFFNFIELVERNYEKENTVSFYADKLHVSPNYLNRLTNEYLEIPPIKIINMRKLVEAMRLLSFSTMNVKAVMLQLGFDDHAIFSNFFKQWTGLSPKEFREICLVKRINH